MDFGTKLKRLRQSRNETLHMAAVGTNIDMTLLSKFERKERIPTVEQAKRIAAYFSIDINELNIELTAERIIFEYGLNDITYRAANLVCEAYIGYATDKAEKE
ncbi:MAG: helix-turn-helix domain-containing protein [Treponema sp.]|nr:helix-turn-helix domain-containing protein [Treponema sp.]